jgi:hypothetical protein
MIRLIEREDDIRSSGDSSLGFGIPVVGEVRLVAPHGGNVLNARQLQAGGRDTPIVGPRDLVGVLKCGAEASIVVGETTLA